jgi:hypothetical protein
LFSTIFFKISALIFIGYLGIIFIDSIHRSFKKNNIFILLNIFIVPLIHFSYGIGTSIGLMKKLGEKLNVENATVSTKL